MPFLKRENFEPILLCYNQSLASENLPNNCFHICNQPNRVLAQRSKEMSCYNIINLPFFFILQILLVCIFHRVDWWMGFVILTTFSWWAEHRTISNTLSELSKTLITFKAVNDLSEINTWIILCCFSTRIT